MKLMLTSFSQSQDNAHFCLMLGEEKESIFPVIGIQAPESVVNEEDLIRKFGSDYHTEISLSHIGDMAEARDTDLRRNGVQIIKTRKQVADSRRNSMGLQFEITSRVNKHSDLMNLKPIE